MKKALFWGSGFLPVVVTAVLLKFLPDKIPTHYGLNGEADAWGAKETGFITAFLALLMCLFSYSLIIYFKKKSLKSNDDKTKKECENNIKTMWQLGIITGILFNLMQYYFLYLSFKSVNNANISIDDGIMVIGLGVLLILTGNILPKAKPNSLFGLRTSWSGKNDKTWAVSQKHGGIMLAADGLLMVICGAVIENKTILEIAVLCLILSVVPAALIISYLAYKKYGDVENEKTQ